MSWIDEVGEDEATGRLERSYADARKRTGSTKVAHILTVQGLDPRALDAHVGLYGAVMFGPGELTRAEREAIGTAVSAANECHY